MSKSLNDAVEAAVLDAITLDVAAGSDPASVAAALAGLYGALARHLEPLMGTRAVRAIYGRSVALAASEAPWIAAGAGVQNGGGPVETLRGCLEHQDSLAATDGVRILLVTFVELLARLVGEGLTARLLAQAWPRASLAAAGQEAKR
jgi:hypothetical protein